MRTGRAPRLQARRASRSTAVARGGGDPPPEPPPRAAAPRASAPPAITPGQLLDATEVGVLLGKSRKAIYTMLQRGQLPYIRTGKRQVRFSHAAILRWLEAMRVETTGEREP